MKTDFQQHLAEIFDPKADSPASNAKLRQTANRMEEFSEDHIAQISRFVFNKTPDSFQPLSLSANAMENILYEVKIDSKSFIYRINNGPHPNQYLEVESRFFNTLANEKIQSLHVHHTHIRNQKFQFDFQVMDKIGEYNLEQVEQQIPPGSKRKVLHNLGQTLAKIHSIKAPGFGFLTIRDDKLEGLQNQWLDHIFNRWETHLNYLTGNHPLNKESENILTDSLATKIAKLMNDNQHLLSLKRGSLLHGDVHDANIVLNQDYTFSGLVDVTQAKCGDPIYDLAYYTTYHPSNSQRL